MKLSHINEGRKNTAYRNAVTNGTSLEFNGPLPNVGTVTARKLTTPEAIQHWSRHACPNWHSGDEGNEPICTVVYENAVHYLKSGPLYYIEVNGKPAAMATPADNMFFDFNSKEYFGIPEWLKTFIVEIDKSSIH